MENNVKESTNNTTVQEKVSVLKKYTGSYLIKPAKKSYIAQRDPKHDGATIFGQAKVYLSPELLGSGMHKTGLTDEEARELETIMGFPKMHLSPFNVAFWGNHKNYPKVGQEGFKLALDNNPMDIIRYCYCKVQDKVAMSWAEALENPRAEFVIVSEEKETRNESSKIQLEMKAMGKLSKMTFNEQVDFLKVYNGGTLKVSKSSSPDFILSTIGKVAKEHPDDFIQTLENPDFKNIVFLQDCVQAGLIKRSGPKYFILGGDQLGNTMLEAVSNLGKPEYSEYKVGLKTKLDSINK